MIGVALSFGLAYLFELTNTRVRTPYDITRTLQMPLLGFIPDQDDDSAVKGELTTTIRTGSDVDDRGIVPADPGTVDCGGPGEVGQDAARGVDCARWRGDHGGEQHRNGMVLTEKKVLLVDANFYRPGLRNSYKNLPAVGLADVVASPEQLRFGDCGERGIAVFVGDVRGRDGR